MYLQDQVEKKSLGGASEVRNILEEVPISTLEHTVMKLYLEDFHAFAMSCGPDTAEVRWRSCCVHAGTTAHTRCRRHDLVLMRHCRCRPLPLPDHELHPQRAC
jgi:hypothetical protein